RALPSVCILACTAHDAGNGAMVPRAKFDRRSDHEDCEDEAREAGRSAHTRDRSTPIITLIILPPMIAEGTPPNGQHHDPSGRRIERHASRARGSTRALN